MTSLSLPAADPFGTGHPRSFWEGSAETVENGIVQGWLRRCASPAPGTHPGAPPGLHLLVDGQEVGLIPLSLPRQAEPENPQWWLFSHILPPFCFDSQPHRIAIRLDDRSALPFKLPDSPPEQEFVFTWKGPERQSWLEGMERGKLRGWALERRTPYDGWKGGTVLEVFADGRKLGRIKANRHRPDVSFEQDSRQPDQPPADPGCGFEFPLPKTLLDGAPHELSAAFAQGKPKLLTNAPLKIRLSAAPSGLIPPVSEKLAGLHRKIESLHAELTRLRTMTASLLEQQNCTLDDYPEWFAEYNSRLRDHAESLMQDRTESSRPLVSLLCPVFKTDPAHLEAALDSVLKQSWTNWELILIGDGPQNKTLRDLIARVCEKRPGRIHYRELKRHRGIAQATNAGLERAKGDFIGFLDHDDELHPAALALMMEKARDGAEILYSDEDKLDPSGRHHSPNFKPAFNYRYLLGCNYICHFLMVRRTLAQEAGLIHPDREGAQDHDYLLRLIRSLQQKYPDGWENKITHVGHILYHWRQTPTSTASALSHKPHAARNGAKAVRAHLKETGAPATASAMKGISLYQVRPIRKHTEATAPRLHIIIPYHLALKRTGGLVRSLLDRQDYPNFDILLVDNWSLGEEAELFAQSWEAEVKVGLLRVEENFNFARLNNLAAAHLQRIDRAASVQNALLLFLNNDVEIRQKDFLSALVREYEIMSVTQKAGAVGARLLYPNKTLQHGGIAVGTEWVASHLHRGRNDGDFGYIGRARLSHEVSAVTGACLLTPAVLFRRLGGFDEKRLKIAYNDVDYCLKLRQAGWRIYYCASASAIHHESLSRGRDDQPQNESRFFAETQFMKEKWGEFPDFRQDPFYPQAFQLHGEPFCELKNPQALFPENPEGTDF